MKTTILKVSMVIALVCAVAQLSAQTRAIDATSNNLIEVAIADNDTVTPVGGGYIPIIIQKIPEDSDNQRSLIPIAAAYNNGVVELDFYGNMGTLYTVVVNNTTGERWSEYIDTADGYACMNVFSYNPIGHYTITFRTDNNENFGGGFYVE